MCPLVSANPIPITRIFPHVKSPFTDPITEMGLTDTFGLYVAYPMPIYTANYGCKIFRGGVQNIPPMKNLQPVLPYCYNIMINKCEKK